MYLGTTCTCVRLAPGMFVGTNAITPLMAQQHRERYCEAWRNAPNGAEDVNAACPPVALPYPPGH